MASAAAARADGFAPDAAVGKAARALAAPQPSSSALASAAKASQSGGTPVTVALTR